MPNSHIDLSSRTAFVTGASQGIGLAIAKALAGYNAHVVLAARSVDRLEREAALIRSVGGTAHAIACDVGDYRSVTAAIQSATNLVGQIDILVNNAGVIEPLAYLAESDPVQWSRAVDVNYKGVYHCMRAVVPGMIEAGGGTVINLSSGAANSHLVGWSHYCSTKAAARKITEVAHQELAAQGITVIGLSPGTVATEMMEKIRDSGINAVSELDWDSHIAPEWVGEAVAYLCGPEAGDLAGEEFSLKTSTGRARVGLPDVMAADQ